MSLAVERVAVRGVWWRQAARGVDPLAVSEPAGDGRWQLGDVVAATYLAEGEATVWAEWYRALAEAALPPRVWLPSALWRIEVELEAIADLSTEARLAAVGLEPPHPGRRTWPPYQRVGARLREEGFAGALAPSAAREGGEALCVFREADEPVGLRATGGPRVVSDPPTPPRGLRT